MLYNYDTYKLYLPDQNTKGSARVKVTMKEEVKADLLNNSINVAIKRYPYCAVYLSVDSMGGFVFSHNDSPVVVIETKEQLPMLGEARVNGHLLYLDYRGKNIYFNISHALAGVRGYMPLVFTTIYEYVRQCYGVEADAPMVNKPESPILPGEYVVPNLEMLGASGPFRGYQGSGGLVLFGDILEEYLNPRKRSYEYHTYEFDDRPVLNYAKENKTSVAGAFLMLKAKALDKVVPDKVTPLCGGIVHNPLTNWGMPHAHSDVETYIYVPYDRELIRGNERAMGEYTRAEIKKQTDIEYTKSLYRKYLEYLERIDSVQGLNAKRLYAKAGVTSYLPSTAVTYVVSYGGINHIGELATYVDSFYNIIEGNMTLSITAMEGKICAAFIQNIREEKYVLALNEVFDEAGLHYKVSGPYRQHLALHRILNL